MKYGKVRMAGNGPGREMVLTREVEVSERVSEKPILREGSEVRLRRE